MGGKGVTETASRVEAEREEVTKTASRGEDERGVVAGQGVWGVTRRASRGQHEREGDGGFRKASRGKDERERSLPEGHPGEK